MGWKQLREMKDVLCQCYIGYRYQIISGLETLCLYCGSKSAVTLSMDEANVLVDRLGSPRGPCKSVSCFKCSILH